MSFHTVSCARRFETAETRSKPRIGHQPGGAPCGTPRARSRGVGGQLGACVWGKHAGGARRRRRRRRLGGDRCSSGGRPARAWGGRALAGVRARCAPRRRRYSARRRRGAQREHRRRHLRLVRLPRALSSPRRGCARARADSAGRCPREGWARARGRCRSTWRRGRRCRAWPARERCSRAWWRSWADEPGRLHPRVERRLSQPVASRARSSSKHARTRAG